MTLVSAISAIMFIIPLSFSLALQFLLEGAIIEGPDSYENVSKSRLICILTVFYGLVNTAVFFILFSNFADGILGIFINDSETKDLAVKALTTYCYIYFADAFQCLTLGILRGMGIERYVRWHGVFCLWLVSLGSALAFTFWAEFGIVGLYFGYGNGLVLMSLINLFYIWKSKWDMIELQAKLNWDEVLTMNLDEDNFMKKKGKSRNSKRSDDSSYVKFHLSTAQGLLRMSSRFSMPFVHLEMLRFGRVIAGEQLDVTIDSRRNIQMTGVGKKSQLNIEGDVRYDWTSETPMTEGICGFQNNSLYCYMNSILQCLLAIPDLRDYYA